MINILQFPDYTWVQWNNWVQSALHKDAIHLYWWELNPQPSDHEALPSSFGHCSYLLSIYVEMMPI